MPPSRSAQSAGLVIIRAWLEADAADENTEALRTRITVARPLERVPAETVTVAGLDAGLDLVRDFLAGLAEAARSPRDR